MTTGFAAQLYRAIYGYGPLQKYAMGVQQPIRIIVKNGNVILEGVVDNESDKNIANIRANSVSGVFSVTNNLQVVKTLTSGVGRQTSARSVHQVRGLKSEVRACSHSPNIGTCRVSVGAPLRRRWVAPITASTVSDSRALRGTKILWMFDAGRED